MSQVADLDTLIIESAVDFAIFAMDLSGSIIRWSRGAEHILGWTETETIGEPGVIIFTPEDRSAALPEKEIATSLRSGRSIDERWHLRKDQTRFWASGEMMTLRSPEGAPIGFLKIVRDRTERWLREQRQLALAKLGEGLANLVELGAMASLGSELVRTALNASGSCYATVGADVHVEGFSIAPQARVTHGHLLETCRQGVGAMLGDTGAQHDSLADATVTASLSATGAFCVVRIVESQRVVAMFALVNEAERHWSPEEEEFMRDIAIRLRSAIERRRAEDALRELASNLEKQVDRRLAERNRLWSNSRDLMAIVDSSATIIETNPAWKATLGWDPQQLVGRTMFEFTDEKGAQTLRDALLSERGQAQFPLDCRGVDRQPRRFEWSLSHEKGVGYLVGRDVTEQLEIEARLRQSQKMEAIGQLTGGIAHDFNNLLAGIIGSVDLLRLRLANKRFDDLDRHIQGARTAAHRAAALSHRLLAFARQQPLDPKPVDLNRLVASMEELLRRTLHVRIQLQLKLDATCLVMSDEHQMENAILNLVINARDAMPDGGIIVIATEDCEPPRSSPKSLDPGRDRKQTFACVSLADDGVGIPPEVVSKVFEPFFTTKPAGQGTGLGLAMIYGFVKQMGGDIDLETRPGKGTTMRLYFPCADQESREAATVSSASYPKGQGERILVVDDDYIVRTTIIELLQELGYVPEGAEGSQSAIDKLRSGGRFDALITDWGLPGLNGGELAKLARALQHDFPICFVTGYNAGDSEIGTLHPNETILTKPIGIEVLARAVGSMLASRIPDQ